MASVGRRSLVAAITDLAVLGFRTVSARVQLRGCSMGRVVQASGRVLAEGRANIRIGDHSKLFGGLVPTRLIARSLGTLSVGSRCTFNYGARIEAHRLVQIGDRCMFGSAVVICDAYGGRVAPIVIEDGVWLAHGVQVRPGVRIGHDAVVSAGSVVTEDVQPEMLAVGNPARTIPLRLVAAHGG
jgi:maltose O-acetyltransferase